MGVVSPWTKENPNRAPCPTPIFWWFKATGDEWTCPDCGKVWVVRDNPSKLISGRVLWPKAIPPSTYWTPYQSMTCKKERA